MSLEKDIERLLDQFIPEIRATFIEVMRDITDRAILVDMVRAIELGDAVAAFQALGMTEAALRPIVGNIERAFEAGGITTGDSFPKRLNTPAGRAVFRFDPRNSRAERILREESSKLVTRVQEETRTNIRSVMQDGVQAGNNPRRTALDIIGRVDPITKRRVGGIIGLSAPQERYVARAKLELAELDENYFSRERRDKRFDRTVRKAINSGTKLTQKQVSQITAKYSDNLLQLRGETIARTEAIAALNRSQMEAVQQAVNMGSVKPSATKRVWDSAGRDGRTRDTHLAMEGQSVGLDEAFTTPGGAKLMFPGDSSMGAPGKETINCRCRVRLKIDWLDGVS